MKLFTQRCSVSRLSILFLLFFSAAVQAQPPHIVNCTPIQLTGNKVFNPAFNTAATYDPSHWHNPFALGDVDHWSSAFSTPNFEAGFPPYDAPLPGIHAAYMNSTYASGKVYSEGIIGKLSPLVPGKEYALTFFLKYMEAGNPNFSHAYNIYLMHCSDAPVYFSDPDVLTPLPPLPPNSQRIFCETNGGSTAWRQSNVCFTPNQNYDMILVFPAVEPLASTQPYTAIACFAFPELISKNAADFSILVNTPDPLNPCIKDLSPSYAVTNATYQWFLNGNLLSTSQTVQLNTATQYGTVTMEVTLPGTPGNSTCSPPCGNITASVSIADCTTPPSAGPVKVIEVPKVESVTPADVFFDYSDRIISYTSIDKINNINPESQEIGVGLLKMDRNDNVLFNKIYKLPGKKLYVKQTIVKGDFYYTLVGIKDGVNCTCNNQKILVLKTNRATGNIVTAYKLDGYYPTSFHEPANIENRSSLLGDLLFISSYGYNEGAMVTGSKIYITILDEANGNTKVYEVYDGNNVNAVIKPTPFFGAGLTYNNGSPLPYPAIELGCTYAQNSNSPAQPLFLYGGGNDAGRSFLYNLDNGDVSAVNFSMAQVQPAKVVFVAQNTDGKLYYVKDNIYNAALLSHVYYKPDFVLTGSYLHSDGFSGYNSSYVNGGIFTNPSLYVRLHWQNDTDELLPVAGLQLQVLQDVNNMFSADTDPDNSVPGNTVGLRGIIQRNDPKNKFYNYDNAPSGCDIPLDFPLVPGNVTRSSSAVKMYIVNPLIQLTNPFISQTGDLAIDITHICVDGARMNELAGDADSYQHRQTPAALTNTMGVDRIEIYNTAGQLIKKTSDSYQIKAICNGYLPATGVPGLYFIKVYNKDKTMHTIKRLQQ